MATQWLG